MGDEAGTAHIASAAAAGATGAAVERILGSMLARLDDGNQRMADMDRKLDRLADRLVESSAANDRHLADHEARIRGIEQDQAEDREDRRSRWSPTATVAMGGLSSVVGALLGIWAALSGHKP